MMKKYFLKSRIVHKGHKNNFMSNFIVLIYFLSTNFFFGASIVINEEIPKNTNTPNQNIENVITIKGKAIIFCEFNKVITEVDSVAKVHSLTKGKAIKQKVNTKKRKASLKKGKKYISKNNFHFKEFPTSGNIDLQSSLIFTATLSNNSYNVYTPFLAEILTSKNLFIFKNNSVFYYKQKTIQNISSIIYFCRPPPYLLS